MSELIDLAIENFINLAFEIKRREKGRKKIKGSNKGQYLAHSRIKKKNK